MPQSLSMNLVHLIYSTKNREASLTPVIRSKLFAYQVGILQEWSSPAIVVGGACDHVHALFVLLFHVGSIAETCEVICPIFSSGSRVTK